MKQIKISDYLLVLMLPTIYILFAIAVFTFPDIFYVTKIVIQSQVCK